MTYSAENYSPAFGLSRNRAARVGALTRIRSALAGLQRRIALWYRVHQTIRLLQDLDDAILRDIGLDRSEILPAARHAATAAGYRS